MSRLQLLALVAGVALLTTTPAAAADLDQDVDRGEEIGTEQVVIDSGHVDIGPRFVDGQWHVLARDDTSAPPVWRELKDMVFRLGDTAVLPAPEGEQFAFIDAEPGSDVHVIPQTEDAQVPWLGWNSQDPDVVDQLVRGMTLRLHGVDGPGQVTVFLQSGNFADAQLLWTSDQPEPQDIWADTNTHVHANWVFTQPGVYLVEVELRGDLADGDTATGRAVLRFAVGEGTNPQEAFSATYVGGAGGSEDDDGAPGGDEMATSESATAEEDAEAAGDDTAEDGGAIPTAAVVIGAAVVLLGALVAAGALRSRRGRRAASSEGTGQ